MGNGLAVASFEHEDIEQDNPNVTSELIAIWTEALISDNEDTARQILETAGDSLRRYLLTGDFLCECHDVESVYQDWRLRIPGFRITRPLTLTIAFGAFKVIKLFLEYQEYMDICQTEWRDNNIFHSLVYLCYLDCTREDEFVAIYNELSGLLKLDQVRKLLYTENKIKKRPAEVAAQVGAFKMLAAIFETKGVYLVKTEVFRTFYKIHWYDVTEYENYSPSNRFSESPLWHLVFLDRDRLSGITEAKTFISDPFLDWTQKKSKALVPLVWAWSVLRHLFILIFTLYDFSEPEVNIESSGLVPNSGSRENLTLSTSCNGTLLSLPGSLRIMLRSFLMIFCTCVIVTDILELIFFRLLIGDNMSSLPRRRKKYVVLVKVYRFNQFLLMISMLISLILRQLPYTTPVLLTVNHILYTYVWTASIWSVLYFLQLIPFMGYFIINIQSMIVDLLRFFILFLLILVPFAFSFHRIARDNQECDERFTSIPRSMYTTFTIMLNMVDFSNYPRGYLVTNALIHLVFVFLVAILLVNFLIALFSQTVSDVREHCDAIIAIQKLSIYWALEFRLSWLLRKSRLYRKRMEKIFYVRDGRVYVTRVEVRCGKPLMPTIMPTRTEA